MVGAPERLRRAAGAQQRPREAEIGGQRGGVAADRRLIGRNRLLRRFRERKTRFSGRF